MYCGNCGKEISDESKFCPYCGWKKITLEESLKNDITNVQYDNNAVVKDYGHGSSTTSTNSEKKVIILVASIVGGILLLCLVAFGAIVLPGIINRSEGSVMTGNVFDVGIKKEKKGRCVVLSSKSYSKNNDLFSWNEYEADSKGNITKDIPYTAVVSNGIKSWSKNNGPKRTYSYDNEGKIVSVAVSENYNITNYDFKYYTDENGRVTRIDETINPHQIMVNPAIVRHDYKYNGNEVIEYCDYINKDGTIANEEKSFMCAHKYDKEFEPGGDCKVIEKITYKGKTEESPVSEQEKWEYDDEGRIIKYEWNLDSITSVKEYEYNDDDTERKVIVSGVTEYTTVEKIKFYPYGTKDYLTNFLLGYPR